MGRLVPVGSRTASTPAPSPELTSRRHIDLLRVCSALSLPR
ncbi:putative leader peptide [Streptomyces lancefieldiae]|uniref:Leader peptide n=1 Tax=Streptomyces lancefieldiae TaxID=3075520 RepID=A0ABU3AFR8_9ACTN|nr:putative leader peptide [Streptomyces sp. DSM 40712]MDT0609021.1 putative leader peptide [Streptomyces sp. DSM 40712]